MPRRIILPLLLLALSVLSAQAAYKAFWVTEAISGITVGPVVNKPGNRFVAGGSSWVVLDSRPGEINFADARTLAVQGPYALAEQRMFELGELAYVFTRVEDYKGDRPGDDASRVSQARRAPAQKAEEPGSRDLPERWVLGPVPSTNPAAHKDAVEPWSIPTLSLRPAVVGFVDLVQKVQYDWKLGGLSGSRKQSLQVVRAGVSGEWNGFHADLGISTGGKTSGTLVKDGLAVSRLRIRGGDGLFAEAGYDYSFLLDDDRLLAAHRRRHLRALRPQGLRGLLPLRLRPRRRRQRHHRAIRGGARGHLRVRRLVQRPHDRGPPRRGGGRPPLRPVVLGPRRPLPARLLRRRLRRRRHPRPERLLRAVGQALPARVPRSLRMVQPRGQLVRHRRPLVRRRDPVPRRRRLLLLEGPP